ncbi:MAG: hypothetical protein M3Y04_09230, partial [Actinomycetota bacterium]|nr:hypothetical protein [Actinomycetota bacterium]
MAESAGGNARAPVNGKNRLRDTRRGAGFAGLVSGAVALGTAELLSRLVPRPSLVLGVGEVVISKVPPRLADAVIGMFGRSDKTVLVVGIVAVSVLLATALGLAARRRPWLAPVGFGIASALGIVAGISRYPAAAPLATLAVGSGGAVAGVLCLRRLLAVRAGRPEVQDSRREVLRLGAIAVGAA